MRTRSVKSRATSSFVSATSIPRSSASEGALTRLTSSSVWPASTPLSVASVSRRVSRPGEVAEVLALDARDARPRRARWRGGRGAARAAGRARAPPCPPRETAGMLTAVETTPPVSAATTCSAVWTPGAVLGLGGRGAEVRGDDDVVVAVEQRVVGDRLGREDVERGAGDLAGVERVLERLVDEQLAAGAVDDAHAVLHLRERLGVEPAARLGRLGQVDGDEVGLAVDVGAGLGLLDPELAEALGGHERVEGEHAHAEALRAGGDELADAAEAEHAERLLVDLDAAELRALPLARR